MYVVIYYSITTVYIQAVKIHNDIRYVYVYVYVNNYSYMVAIATCFKYTVFISATFVIVCMHHSNDISCESIAVYTYANTYNKQILAMFH